MSQSIPGKCLVIGGSGFLGQHLCRQLLLSGMDVSILDPSQPPTNYGAWFSPAEINSISDLFETVYLLAAHIPYGNMNSFTQELLETNIAMPLKVAEKFRYARLVYISSVSVYGKPIMLPVDETHPFNNPSAYGLSKLAGESAVFAHPNHIVLRISSLYGAGMNTMTFLPQIIKNARHNRQIILLGDGKRKQDYLHVKDAARMIQAAGNSTISGNFNLVNGSPVSNTEAAHTISDILGNVTIIYKGDDQTPDTTFSSHKWQSVFSVLPEVSFSAGIGEMIAYEG